MPQQYRLMAAYNRKMNQQFYAACAELDDAARKQDRGAFFKSIHGTLNHLLLVDRLWLGGFKKESVAYSALDEELFADFAELRAARDDMDEAIIAWANTLTEAQLKEPFNDSLDIPLWLTVTHFFNHQTHHRGQLSALLSQCGGDYGVTDIPWVPGMADLAKALNGN
ncbi:MAG: DinB family protein [Gammaproteobacteria bacterium]